MLKWCSESTDCAGTFWFRGKGARAVQSKMAKGPLMYWIRTGKVRLSSILKTKLSIGKKRELGKDFMKIQMKRTFWRTVAPPNGPKNPDLAEQFIIICDFRKKRINGRTALLQRPAWTAPTRMSLASLEKRKNWKSYYHKSSLCSF